MPWSIRPAAVSGVLALLLIGCETLDIGGQTATVKLDRQAIEHVIEAAQDSGEYAAAAGVSEKYAAAHPSDAAAQVSFGNVALEAGQVDKSIEVFRNAIKLDPSRGDAHVGLGRAYLAMHKP